MGEHSCSFLNFLCKFSKHRAESLTTLGRGQDFGSLTTANDLVLLESWAHLESTWLVEVKRSDKEDLELLDNQRS